MTKNPKPENNEAWYIKWYTQMDKINSAGGPGTNFQFSEDEMQRTEAAMSDMKDFPKIWESILGLHAYVRKNYPAALEHLTTAISAGAQGPKNDGSWSDYYVRGRTHAAMGNHAAALADYNHVIDVQTNEEAIFELHLVQLARSLTHHNLGNHETALADLQSAIEGSGNYQIMLFNMERHINENPKKVERALES